MHAWFRQRRKVSSVDFVVNFWQFYDQIQIVKSDGGFADYRSVRMRRIPHPLHRLPCACGTIPSRRLAPYLPFGAFSAAAGFATPLLLPYLPRLAIRHARARAAVACRAACALRVLRFAFCTFRLRIIAHACHRLRITAAPWRATRTTTTTGSSRQRCVRAHAPFRARFAHTLAFRDAFSAARIYCMRSFADPLLRLPLPLRVLLLPAQRGSCHLRFMLVTCCCLSITPACLPSGAAPSCLPALLLPPSCTLLPAARHRCRACGGAGCAALRLPLYLRTARPV